MINRNQLAIFHAVAEEGGFGKGAKRLHITQPAVSAQISDLENHLGVKLFHRVKTGVTLTDAGEVLAKYAKRIAVLEAEAAVAMNDLKTLNRGRLAIGASTTIGAYYLPRMLREFQKQFPQITFDVVIGNTDEIHQELLDGSIGIALTEGQADHPELNASVFREDDLLPVVADNHPFTKKKSVTLEEFLNQPFILREQGSGTRKVVTEALKTKGHINIKPAFSLGSTEAVKEAVAAGLGVAFISSLATADEIKLGRLKMVNLKDFSIHRPLHQSQLKGRTPSEAEVKFMELLKVCQYDN